MGSAAAEDEAGHAGRLERPGGRPPVGDTTLRLHATRVGAGVHGGPALALVTIREDRPAAPRGERHGLTPRESEVAELLARRLTTREIAERLVISRHTVRRRTERVFAKLGVRSKRDVEGALAGSS